MSASGGVYIINGGTSPVGFRAGVYRLLITTGTTHPLRLAQESGFPQCAPSWTALDTVGFSGPGQSLSHAGPLDGEIAQTYYHGSWSVEFPNDASCVDKDLSLVCAYHGYMGSENRLDYKDPCYHPPSPPPTLPPPLEPPPSLPPVHPPLLPPPLPPPR